MSERSKQFKLDKTYMTMALVWSKMSYCKRKKVGCLIVKNKTIISDGYNGTPSGMCNNCEDEKGETRDIVLHAEANALTKLIKSNNSALGSTLYITLSPCFNCSKLILQSGIKRVVYLKKHSCQKGIKLLNDNNIETYKLNI